MIRPFAIALAAAVLLAVASTAPALAQEVTVQQFMARVDRLPPGALALLSPDSGRLKRMFEAALSIVFMEQFRARQAGRRPATCIPERFSMSSEEAFAYFNAMPQARRERMTVTEGARLWMTHKFPCP